MSFRHSQYRDLLGALRASGRRVVTVAEYLRAGDERRRFVILRHDVDRRPGKALDLAQLEHSLGFRSTYYFRADRSGAFPVRFLREIAALGHEIGYHYETLSRSRGDVRRALDSFALQLSSFRGSAECTTVSMHGAPLSLHDNQRLAEHIEYEKLGLLGDAVRHVENDAPYYFTDTGGRWSAAGHGNLRDRLGRPPPPGVVPGAGEAFVRFLETADAPVYVSTHPERWSRGVADFVYSAAIDFLARMAKQALVAGRARRGDSLARGDRPQ